MQPGNVVAQLESSLIFALGSALKERITIKDGLVEQSNFHDYEIMRLSETPQIKVEVIRSGDIPLPVGELGMPGVVPAVANALFALTGKAPAQRAVHAEPRQSGAGIAIAMTAP